MISMLRRIMQQSYKLGFAGLEMIFILPPTRKIIVEDSTTIIAERDSFFKRPYSLTTVLAAGILLFFLPFVQIKCGSSTLAENTGVGIALGKPWKMSANWGRDFSRNLRTSMDEKRNKLRSGINVFAIVALVAGVLGLAFSLIKDPMRPLVAMCAGILAAIMLIALMIYLKIQMRSSGATKNAGMGMVIKVQFTIWYYLSLFCFALAGLLGLRHYKDELNEKLKSAHDFEFEKKE